MAGIEDQEIAFAFNIECAEALYLWEREQEATKIASLFAGMTAGVVGPNKADVAPKEAKVERW